jgi:signal transduction histidine kinase
MSAAIEQTLLEGLVTYLQDAAEVKDTKLSHELHDELGGLMGAVAMDLDAVRRIRPALSRNALILVGRVKETLEQAIDLKRLLIENLRPSILENFGLFAALRWQINKTSGGAHFASTQSYPPVEPQFEAPINIALFRIAQEALSITINRASVKSIELAVSVDRDNFWMRFAGDGAREVDAPMEDPTMIMASMRHRVRALGGNVQAYSAEGGRTVLMVSMPLPQVA